MKSKIRKSPIGRAKNAANGSAASSGRIVNSLRAAASVTKLPIHRIQEARAAGCEAFKPNGRIDCDLLVDFLAKGQDATNGEAPDYYLERAKAIRAKRLLDEQKHAERGKLLWRVEDIRRGWFRNVISCKKKLYAAEHEVAAECALRGFTPEQATTIREIVSKHIRTAIKELHAGDWGRVECPNCKMEAA